MHTATEHHHSASEGIGSSITCPTCEIAPFARNNYFTGKLLLERDFTDEQRYHIDKLRLHNQRLHGFGVVCGLQVVADTNPACRDRYVTVLPGLAIDCCGHEILVREEVRVDITRLASYAALTAAGAPAGRPLQLCIRYRECGTETVPVLYDDCAWDNDRCAPNRILESYDFDLLGPDDEPIGPGHDHVVSLGLVRTIRIDRATRLASHGPSDRLYVATRPVPGTKSAGDLFQLTLGSETILSSADLEGEVADIDVSPDGGRVYVLRGDDASPPWAWIDVYDAAAIDEPPVDSVNLDIELGDHAELAVTASGLVFALANQTVIALDASLAPVDRIKIAGGRCLAAGITDELVYVGADAGVVVSVDGAVQPLAPTAVITLAGAPAVLDIAVIPGQGGVASADDLVALTDAAGLVLVSAGAEVGTASVHATASRLGAAVDGRRGVVAGSAGVQIVNLVQLRSGTAGVRAPFAVGGGIVDGDGDVLVAADLVYVAYPGGAPAPGGVAVLGLVGTLDCDDLLWKSMQECPSCDDPGCIVLATMLGYDAGDRLVDKGTAAVGSTEVEIDNRLGRPLLPSTQTLAELVECLLARPVPQGGTGHDGIDGVDGQDGNDGTDGTDGVDGTDGIDGQDGQNGRDGEGLEAGLVRIQAISWLHRGGSPVIDIDDGNGNIRQGFAIGFEGEVRSADLDHNIFRVRVDHTDEKDREIGLICRCDLRGDVVPIDPVYDGDRIASGKELTSESFTRAIAFILRKGLFEFLLDRGFVDTLIELHGDFVLDTEDKPRAIDAEFVRAEFLTGDRPAGSDFGVQGGLFESWFTLSREFVPAGAGKLNIVSRSVLESLPGIGRTYATRIVNERRVAPFVDEADFLARIRPPDHLWTLMRDHLDFTPPEA